MKPTLEALIDDIIALRDGRCKVGGEHYLITDLILQLAIELQRHKEHAQRAADAMHARTIGLMKIGS